MCPVWSSWAKWALDIELLFKKYLSPYQNVLYWVFKWLAEVLVLLTSVLALPSAESKCCPPSMASWSSQYLEMQCFLPCLFILTKAFVVSSGINFCCAFRLSCTFGWKALQEEQFLPEHASRPINNKCHKSEWRRHPCNTHVQGKGSVSTNLPTVFQSYTQRGLFRLRGWLDEFGSFCMAS